MTMEYEMDRVKAWVVEKFGLEPGDPRWWNAKKVEGWWYVIRQQLLLHPLFGLATMLPFAALPKLYVSIPCGWVMMGIHELTQFKTMPAPESVKNAICAEDAKSASPTLWIQICELGVRVNGRHVNGLDRCLDVFGGGTMAGVAVYFAWYGLKLLTA